MKKTQYVYESMSGNSVVVTADQVGEKWIQVLQEEDRKLENAERRYRYHEPAHYNSFDEAEDAVDTNPYLTDFGMEPLRLLIKLFCEEEQREQIRKLMEAMDSLTDRQRELIYRKFAAGQKNTEIAEALGITQVADSVQMMNALTKLKRIMRN